MWWCGNPNMLIRLKCCITSPGTLTPSVAIVFGTPIAYALARVRFPGVSVVDALIDLPIVLPPTVAGVALLTAFGRRGLLGEPIEDWTGFTFGFRTTAVIMAQLLVAAPFYIRAAKSGFEAVDVQVERVAYTLGASRVRTFFRITAPQARPALAAGIVLCWARSMGELGVGRDAGGVGPEAVERLGVGAQGGEGRAQRA